MIRKRCGVNLGREILNEAKQIFEVHDFWRKLSHLNSAIKKASKGKWQKNRVIIIEIETVKGLTSWLQHNKVNVFYNPTEEEMRREMASPHASFFLFTVDEYRKRQEAEDFQRIINKLPKPLDLSVVSQNSKLNQEEVLNAFSEVNNIPYCARNLITIKESSLVNLVLLLIQFKNYLEFCCEALYCTEEKTDKCKVYWSKFSLGLKPEFYYLLRSEGIYYPISLLIKAKFPRKYHFVDINSYTNEFANPLELAIFLHDSYQIGALICPGFGVSDDFEDRPDAYLLDYAYPLEDNISIEQIASLIFLNALGRSESEIGDFLENVKNKIKKLPFGTNISENVSKYESSMDRCYKLWHFYREEILLLYAIWRFKKLLESTYQKTKIGLTKLNSLEARSLLEKIHSLLYSYKDFLEHDIAVELGINQDLVKEVFKNINEIAKGENKVDSPELLLLLYHNNARDKLSISTLSYATKKLTVSKIRDDILFIINEVENMGSDEIAELLPYVLPLADYPIFGIEEKISFLHMLRKKQLGQTREIIEFIKATIMDDILDKPYLSVEIDKLVNQWETGNPLNFFKRRIEEEIEQDQFDSNLFKKAFGTFCSINTLKLFRREPSRFFDYQHTLDKYISLKMKKSGKQYFDYFQPITSVFDTIRKLQEENKKVILLIFDGLGFMHSYFACLEVSRKESKQLTEFLEHIISLFQKGDGQILSSLIPTVTGVNHIALLFGERLLYEDSFLIRMTDDSFASDKSDEKAKTFSVLGLRDEDRRSATYRLRLEESNLQRPTGLWDIPGGQVQKKGLLISANSERSFLSYLFKGNAAFKQVDSYTNAIEEALSDKSHDLVVSQVNLMDAFLQSINVRPPALIDDIVTGYWEAYLDLWKNVITRISKGFKGIRKGTVLIITADHGLAWGETAEFKETTQILSSLKDVKYLPKYNVGELFTSDGKLVGAGIPGHRPMKFMSIFLLKRGLDEKGKIKEALEFAEQNGDIVFEEINIEENKRNLTIKPDFLIFPTIGMFSRPDRRKYYGGIHGGISMCELFIPLVLLEK